MRYQLFDAFHQSMKPLGAVLDYVDDRLKSDSNPMSKSRIRRMQSAVLKLSGRLFRDYPKQTVKGRNYAINEDVILDKPFCNLMRFHRDGLKKDAPKVLFVAALSGHHATLSKDTFREFLPDHDVYVTDWKDARSVPVEDGRFNLEDYISYVIEFLQTLGSGVNIIALCQSGPAALVASAVMSKSKDKCRPQSLVMMASPMDVRINPGFISKAADLFDMRLWKLANIHKVPKRHAGAGRLVYPGALQLSGFMSMNIRSHVAAHKEFASNIYHENNEEIEKHKDFYDEYYAMLDMPAEFCLETMERIFVNHDVAENRMTYKGEKVDFADIDDIPIYAIEGANDDMVLVGQCTAVTDFCTGLADKLKHKHVQEGVGHYGIFNGSIYKTMIKKFITESRQISRS